MRYGFARGEPWAWWRLSLGLGAWYIFDSTLSGYWGVWLNVASNTVILAMFAVPLVATAPRMLGRRGRTRAEIHSPA